MPSWISSPYQLDESISKLKCKFMGLNIYFNQNQIFHCADLVTQIIYSYAKLIIALLVTTVGTVKLV